MYFGCRVSFVYGTDLNPQAPRSVSPSLPAFVPDTLLSVCQLGIVPTADV